MESVDEYLDKELSLLIILIRNQININTKIKETVVIYNPSNNYIIAQKKIKTIFVNKMKKRLDFFLSSLYNIPKLFLTFSFPRNFFSST